MSEYEGGGTNRGDAIVGAVIGVVVAGGMAVGMNVEVMLEETNGLNRNALGDVDGTPNIFYKWIV